MNTVIQKTNRDRGEPLVAPGALRAWVSLHRPKPGALFRLLVFPFAGNGASAYNAWADLLPPTVDVLPVQLPGRENRMKETPFLDVFALVEVLADVVRPYTDIPFAFFGHSMGALIAYELARHMRRLGDAPPARLLLSGHRAPHLPNRFPPLSALPDSQLARELHHRYGGIPDIILRDLELLDLFLPILRADITLVETYTYRAAAPLDCPLSIFGGRQDPIVSESELEAWTLHTRRACRLRLFPGDHFFIQKNREHLVRAIADDLAEPAVASVRDNP